VVQQTIIWGVLCLALLGLGAEALVKQRAASFTAPMAS
jgi:hypothetical protein